MVHTNICSLNANAEHLGIRKTSEHWDHQLDFNFDLIVVSNKWTTKSDYVQNISKLENDRPFTETLNEPNIVACV